MDKTSSKTTNRKLWPCRVSALILFITFLIVSLDVYAQSNNRSKQINQKATSNSNRTPAQRNKTKRQVLDFEDQLVEGDVNRSELLILLQRKRYNFGRLIKLREDFLPEMRRSESNINIGSQ